jgi:hypothetical protein
LGYADALHNGPFNGDEKALRALEQVDMISILLREGEEKLFFIWGL